MDIFASVDNQPQRFAELRDTWLLMRELMEQQHAIEKLNQPGVGVSQGDGHVVVCVEGFIDGTGDGCDGQPGICVPEHRFLVDSLSSAFNGVTQRRAREGDPPEARRAAAPGGSDSSPARHAQGSTHNIRRADGVHAGATPDCDHPDATADSDYAGAAPGADAGATGDCDCTRARPDHAHAGAAAHGTDAGGTEAKPDTRALRHQMPMPIRAIQPIAPALRRAVLVRDHHCCRVPGCKNTAFLDLHHIELRSEGGLNVIWNILTICGAHHRATHQGTLLIERNANGEVCFYHGDGTPYGQALEPQVLDVQAKLFSALRNMGFKEGEVRAVLEELRRDDGLRGASIQDLLREALRRIRPHRSRTVRN